MINMELVSMDILRTKDAVDAAEYPEIREYLSNLMADRGVAEESPFAIAAELLKLDRPKPLPNILIGFLKRLFDLEIAEGNPDAMNDLGALYYSGSRGFPQSFEQAVHYYRMAAGHGSRQAQENLGYCYYYGRAMDRPDYDKAFHYFLLGALDGHLISLYKIGDMYLHGYGVEKNETEAFYIYLHCVESLNEETENAIGGPVWLRLGKMFLKGTGTAKDPGKAMVCFQKAEPLLYNMVMDGSVMYRKSLKEAVRGQAAARKLLSALLPKDEWVDE